MSSNRNVYRSSLYNTLNITVFTRVQDAPPIQSSVLFSTVVSGGTVALILLAPSLVPLSRTLSWLNE